MIFVTVGSMFPFDRLVRAVDDLVRAGHLSEEVFAQIGSGAYEPSAIPFERFMEKDAFEAKLSEARCIVSHAGIGSIATALKYKKSLVVLPRLKRFGEHVNDHQVATARRYAELGHVLLAENDDQLLGGICEVASFRPRPRVINTHGVVDVIGTYLSERLRKSGLTSITE